MTKLIDRTNGPMRRAIPWVLACGLAVGALPARGQTCVTDAAWQAAVNGLNNTDNATHAAALYRALLTFQAAERSSGVLPAWPTRHGAQPTTTITAEEARAARGGGAWGGWDHIIDSLQCLDDAEQVVQDPDPPEDPDPPAPPPAQDAAGCVTDDAWSSAVSGLGGTNSASHAQAFYRALIRFQAAERSNGILPIWPTRHGAQPTTAITAAEARAARGGGAWGGWDHVIDALQCLDDAEAPAASDTDDDEVVVVDPEPEIPPQRQVDPFCRQSLVFGAPLKSGTITMKATGGWPGGAFNERAGISGGIEIEVDICNIGVRNPQNEIDLSDEGTGICVDHLKIDGWTRKDLPGQPVRWCGLIADGDMVKAGWTVEGTKSGKPDVYAEGARGRITFRGTVRAYDDGVVRGDRTLRSVRAYFNRAVWNESGGHAHGDYNFVNNLPNRTVRDRDAATVSLERRFVYGGDHHGWNYVVDVDTPIVTGRSGGGMPTSTPEYWTMAITAGGKGFWVRVPSGRIFSGRTHDALPLASLRANMGGTLRTMKEWCGRSESERGNMQYASVEVQGIAGPDPTSQITFSELAAGTDLCNP